MDNVNCKRLLLAVVIVCFAGLCSCANPTTIANGSTVVGQRRRLAVAATHEPSHTRRTDVAQTMGATVSGHAGHNSADSPLNYALGSEAMQRNQEVATGRTFGRIRRLQMLMLPIMFKLGALSVLMLLLLFLTLKSVLIGKLLLVINLGFILAKLLVWKEKLTGGGGGGGHSEHSFHHGGWSSSPYQKEVHLHIHGGPPSMSGHSPYAGHEHPKWARDDNSLPERDLSKTPSSVEHYRLARRRVVRLL